MKKCTKCGIAKPFTQFNKKKTSLDGYNNQCKDCKRIYTREHYKKNPETYLKRNRKQKEKLIALVKTLKEDGCSRCGYNEHPSALDFHHLRDKDASISNLINSGNRKKLLTEVEKCIILCANCHRIEHSN